jgi:16S rRNA processing protein RimM
MAEWVTVALIKRSRGNRGEVAALSETNRMERFAELSQVFLFAPGEPDTGGREAKLESAWEHNGRLILKFAGVDTISDAEKLAGYEVRIPREERPELAEEEFYHSDLVGCEVVDCASGVSVGRVIAVHEYGGPLLLEVLPESGLAEGEETGMLVPFARSICRKIDVAGKRIEADLPDGLRDLNRR